MKIGLHREVTVYENELYIDMLRFSYFLQKAIKQSAHYYTSMLLLFFGCKHSYDQDMAIITIILLIFHSIFLKFLITLVLI